MEPLVPRKGGVDLVLGRQILQLGLIDLTPQLGQLAVIR